VDKKEISQLSKDTLVETFLDVMIDVSCLRFNACAYFYKLKDKEEIDPKEIEHMLRDVTEGKVHRYLFDICRENIGNARYSMRVFKDKPRTPKFIGVENEQWQEQKTNRVKNLLRKP